jgi:hypothetical protein
MENEFVNIPSCDGYQVNKVGEVRSYGTNKHNKILKPMVNHKGYFVVECNNHSKLIHRLVGEVFIPNPHNLETMDHINNIPNDNRVENLRWMTRAENSNRRNNIVNSKGYFWSQHSWRVGYTIDTIKHTRRFKHEDDAEFYVSLLKAIYPRF